MNFMYITLLIVVVVQFSLQNLIKNEKQNRINKGTTVVPHSAPYMVVLLLKIGDGTSMCGGSLVKPKFILTAAHCLMNATSIKVIIGIASLQQAYKNKNWVDISTFKLHRYFDAYNLKNDLAIIELRVPVVLSNKIALVELPKRKAGKMSLAGKHGRLTGHGALSDDNQHLADYLKELKVRIVSTDNCRGIPIQYAQICAYAEGNGYSCTGDSGGPLMLENTNIQIGITLYGSTQACAMGYPHVFTNTGFYYEWIRRTAT